MTDKQLFNEFRGELRGCSRPQLRELNHMIRDSEGFAREAGREFTGAALVENVQRNGYASA